jgi:hypothetical protein
MVLNSDAQILVKSAPYEKVGEVYDFLYDLKIILFENNCDSEGFHIVEHILLRPRCEDCLDGTKPAIDMQKCLNPQSAQPIIIVNENGKGDTVLTIGEASKFPNDVKDPYSFWITVVASENWKRFNHPTNRAYFEQTLRGETPAHIGVRVCWLTNEQMYDFETAYKKWLLELAKHKPDICAVDEAMKHLVEFLNTLTCHCCGEEEADLKLACV